MKSKITEKQARLIIFIIVLPVALMLAYKLSSLAGKKSVSASQFVDLQQGAISHPGYRRAHAKGICISGVFESNGALSELSEASVLRTGQFPFVGRFSIAGNDPSAPDLNAPVRSLALSIQQSDDLSSQWRSAMNTPPVMAVGTPDEFYEQLLALAPDPETNQRDPNKIKAFFASHPQSKDFLEWKQTYTPANSFAGEIYNSINAFYLVNQSGTKQAVRWQAVPSKLQGDIPVMQASDPDALQQQLTTMLQNQAIQFDLLFTLASEEDDVSDPTVLWPSTRQVINAGKISIDGSQAQKGGACEHLNFDPLILPQGLEATADPILRARSAAYAESYRRRAKEVLIGEYK